MKIKERLANQRKAINKTQAQMADEIGISLTSYKKYESGEGLPTMENLVKIADALEISIDELCGRWATDENQELMLRLKKIQQLDEEERKAMSMVLESMLIRHSTKSILNHGA
ncbi:XRE family transcriptional regulator [Vibrio cholerae]|uniref:transcriptional repressor RstR n=1 Tax=Vibrio cholerae TaxID=666 RepID=UPI000C29DA48|nr:transcriptional repressor RstR [Vibrio cholerae]PJS02974.1 XRE family transcriptional regulator [Vibrio cholerae]